MPSSESWAWCCLPCTGVLKNRGQQTPGHVAYCLLCGFIRVPSHLYSDPQAALATQLQSRTSCSDNHVAHSAQDTNHVALARNCAGRLQSLWDVDCTHQHLPSLPKFLKISQFQCWQGTEGGFNPGALVGWHSQCERLVSSIVLSWSFKSPWG